MRSVHIDKKTGKVVWCGIEQEPTYDPNEIESVLFEEYCIALDEILNAPGPVYIRRASQHYENSKDIHIVWI